MLFSELGLRAELLRAVEANGYREATPIQQQAIPPILNGADVLAAAQTGTGKTRRIYPTAPTTRSSDASLGGADARVH